MSDEIHVDKFERCLKIYARLMDGHVVKKAEEARRFHVNEKSIQRDIEDIRIFLDEDRERTGVTNTVVYDRGAKGYRLETIYEQRLSKAEVLAVAKILLDSRGLTKKEMGAILDKLIMSCVPGTDQKLIQELIGNEMFHYIEPRHKTVFLDKLWTIGEAIHAHKFIEIRYKGAANPEVKTRKLKPLAIMFSEYYFYLTAFIDDEKVRENFKVPDDPFPTIYRFDRIQGVKVLDERFHIPYSDRFEEGELRKRIQFMYGGRLRTVRFRYKGPSVESVLDRLPTAKVEKEELVDGKKVYHISAEVFGDGIDIWLRSQGDHVELLQKAEEVESVG